MSFSIIAAIGKNNELGKDNNLIWHLPEDQYEQCYHALAIEQMGANKDALRYMQWVADQHPLDDGIQKCLEDMKGRIETVGNLTK